MSMANVVHPTNKLKPPISEDCDYIAFNRKCLHPKFKIDMAYAETYLRRASLFDYALSVRF